MKRNFDEWLGDFKSTIYGTGYYVDFDKIYEKIDGLRYELSLMNGLVGSKSIEEDFRKLVKRYPEVCKCVPLLMAVRQSEIEIYEKGEITVYSLYDPDSDIERYVLFMKKSGLFHLISSRIISSVSDYVMGVEVGLDSNARKNRGGKTMENLVENFIRQTGAEYYKEMYAGEIERRWNLDLSSISHQGQSEKRFDFVVNGGDRIFAIETNYYSSGGSKLNETARSYKLLALESEEIENFSFVWVTDGKGWKSARNNLRETFDAMEHIYSIKDLENGAFKEIFGNP
jgi:type II restriction enzyme